LSKWLVSVSVSVFTFGALVCASRVALAQAPPPELPPPAAPAPAAGTPNEPPPVASAPVAQARPIGPASDDVKGVDGAPPPHTGFQLAVRTGVAIPFGKIEEGKSGAMSDTFSPQVPFVLDIGGKVIPNLFIGAYLGLALGGAGGNFADACKRANATCVGVGVRFGIEAQWHFMPDAKMDPWIGYGIGYAGEGASGQANGVTTSLTVAGPEYGHFSGGLDFRLNKTIGIGPMVDFGIGRYTRAKTETLGVTREGDLQNTALHEWLTLGVRMVVLP